MTAPAQLAGYPATEVDGVRVLWTDVPGPLRGCLQFGVGQAHEPLVLHGATHLVEHLVLSERPEGPHAYNGATGLVSTSFVVAGGEDDVVSHLAHVCRALGGLPLDRLEHERGVMRSEAAQRSPSRAADALLTWRFGAQGFGTSAYDELALRWAGPGEVTDWARRFGSDNAVLWLSSPPPAALRLPLPRTGVAVAAPPLAHPASPAPGSFAYATGGTVFSLLMAREPAASPAGWLLMHRLHERLRNALGLSYGPQAASYVLDAGTRLMQVLVPGLEENAAAVTEAVCEVLEDVRSRSATDDEWQRMQAQRRLALDARTDGDRLGALDNAAQSLLLGREPEPLEEFERRTDAVTPDEARRHLEAALTTVMIGAPALDRVPETLARRLPAWSTSRVTGRTWPPTDRHPDAEVSQLVVGDAGVTLLRKDPEQLVTVQFHDVAAAMT